MNENRNYWQQIMRRRLSRRSLLRNSALTGIGLATGSSILGCGSQTTPANTPTATSAGAKATVGTAATSVVAPTAAPTIQQPRTGGILTTYLNNDISDYSIISASSTAVNHVMSPIYNGLVMVDPMDPKKIINDLAEKVELSPDGKVYTFTLLKGIKFHDGKPMTSADVKYSFDIVRNPPKGIVSRRAGTLAVVDGIEAPDDYTVRFILKQPSPSLLAVLSQSWMGVMPKHILEKGDMKKEAVGTGPFMLKEYVSGVSTELVRNPNYHIKGRPYVDGVKFFVVPDPATYFAYLRTGQLNFFVSIDSEMVAIAEKDFGDKVVVQKGPFLVFPSLNFNSKRKPWDDVRMRKAASLAVDRAEAIKVVHKGYGDLGGIMPPGGPWTLPLEELAKIPGYGKDVVANRAEAKKLMAEAGYPNGLSATMLTRKGTAYEPFALFVQDQWSKIGIDCKLDVQENAAANDMINKRSYDLATWVHGANVDDPDSIFGDLYNCGAGYNFSDVCSKEVDDLFAKQSQTLDPAERKKLVQELEKATLLLYGKVPIYWWQQSVAFSRNVRDYKLNSSSYLNHRLDHVWLAK